MANKRSGTTAADDAVEVDEGDKPAAKLDKASAQNAADMEKVTDFAEEKEFSKDATSVLDTVSSVQSKNITTPTVITLKKSDIDALIEHFEVKRSFAEKLLKKHHGDMKSAVRELLYGPSLTPPKVLLAGACARKSSKEKLNAK